MLSTVVRRCGPEVVLFCVCEFVGFTTMRFLLSFTLLLVLMSLLVVFSIVITLLVEANATLS